MDLYRTVLHEGLRDDLPRYLNQDLLLQLWPVLRTLVGRTVRAVWGNLDVATENPAPNATSTSGGPLGVSTVHGNHDEVSARASPERQSCETGAAPFRSSSPSGRPRSREPTPQEFRRQEHSPWTRVPKYDEEFIGRLALGAPAGNWYQHSYFHSDGARWTLESRLGHLLQDLERLAAEAELRQREKELRGRAAAALVCGRRPGSRAAGRAAPGEGSDRADAGLAAGRRDPRLLPGRPPRPNRRHTGCDGRGGPAGVGRGVCGTTRPAPDSVAHSAGSTGRARVLTPYGVDAAWTISAVVTWRPRRDGSAAGTTRC